VGRQTAGDDPAQEQPEEGSSFTFDRHLVLEQLGGWRGMVDASLPTVVFIVANALAGLTVGIWTALGAAVLVFLLRLVRRQSIQQGISGLFAVAVAVAIAAASGEARDFFVVGILRNAAIGVVLVGSIPVRRPLIGVIAEFLAPSHLGAMTSHSLPSLRRRIDTARGALQPRAVDPRTGRRPEDPAPERHWREDRRMVRAYGWLTLMWGVTFLVRAVLQAVLYQVNDVTLLGSVSLLLGLPVTAVELVVTLWVVARLHRHRAPEPAGETGGAPEDDAPAP
jgi:FtsH-binding integral membrane protein